jgi:hypothetical protein
MADNNDTLIRIYSTLKSLRANLPNIHVNNSMEWPQLQVYIDALDKLETLGVDVSDFRIPPDMLKNERVQANSINDETVDTGRSSVTEGYLKTKLDALLTYFDLNTDKSSGKTQIGFQAPDSA